MTVEQDLILFRSMGTPLHAKLVVSLERPSDKSTAKILKEWDKLAAKMHEENNDPMMSLLTETPEQKAHRWKMDAIVWENPAYAIKQAKKVRNKLIKQQDDYVKPVKTAKSGKSTKKQSHDTKVETVTSKAKVKGGESTGLAF